MLEEMTQTTPGQSRTSQNKAVAASLIVPVRLAGGRGYEIEIGAGLLGGVGAAARRTLSPHARRIVVVSNRRVFELYGTPVVQSLSACGFRVERYLIGDGERHKNLRTVGRVVDFITACGLERSDALLALGGGVVGDVTGFAAAVYLRGVDFLQVPTTLLAQIDSSVGGKTGVNAAAGKNLIGAFHQPRHVVIDTDTLRTLPARELTAGWCEAIKQGAVGGAPLFARTRDFLLAFNDQRHGAQGGKNAAVERANAALLPSAALAELIARQCAFKAKIVAGDEREEINRADSRSRRVLNFGHTTAHALEALTQYRRFRHGEAVGYGMLVACEISRRAGLLAEREAATVRSVVQLAGRLPHADDLDPRSVERALAADKKAVGGEVRWVLLEKVGRARLVGARELPPGMVRDSIRVALARPDTAAA